MRPLRRLLRSSTLALLPLLGCAARPHGYLHVHFEHRDKTGQFFRDSVTIDGKPQIVGAGRGGELTRRLATGSHVVRVSSTFLKYDLEPVERVDPSGPCVDEACNTRFSHVRNELELLPRDGQRCEKTVQIEVRAGETTSVAQETGASLTCDPS